jgi:ribosomal protein L37AE/L43A
MDPERTWLEFETTEMVVYQCPVCESYLLRLKTVPIRNTKCGVCERATLEIRD